MGLGISRRGFLGSSAVGAMVMTSLETAEGAVAQAGPVRLDAPVAVQSLPTPALIVDVDAMERNLRKMADHLKSQGVGIRPHSKTHKCPIIAKKQMALGAVGICCAKVSEAEVMADAGLESILITSPVVTPEKISRVVAVAKRIPGLQMVVDNPKTVDDFHDAAKAAGVTLRVVIDLDTGTRRTGIALGEPAVALAKRIHKRKSLQFDGLQAYAGHLMHVKGHKTRKTMSIAAFEKALDTKAQIEKAGMDVGVLTGGGTGTFDIDSGISGVTDMQTGSYLFMDVQYREIGDVNSEVFDEFEPSLFVLLTAISQPVKNLITVDGGYKAFASDSVLPEFVDRPGLVYHWGGDEHGIVQIKKEAAPVALGDKLALIVSHCDPTVNLYDYYHPYRDGQVEELWPISARGKSQ